MGEVSTFYFFARWAEEEGYVADMNRGISLMGDARQKINQTSPQIQCHKEHRQFSTDQEPGSFHTQCDGKEGEESGVTFILS
jgi:hypothetical protein